MFVLQIRYFASSVALLAALFLGSIPSMAQSGIDSLGNGGSLGGDPAPSGTGVEQVVIDSSANGSAKSSRPEYYSLSGQRIQAPRRGEVYIIRWREQGVWRKKKTASLQ